MDDGQTPVAPSGSSAVATMRLGTVLLTVKAELQTGRGKPSYEELSLFARTLYQERQLRNKIFSAKIFGEPAWDMLLDLYASEAEGKLVSISSASLAAAVPGTTGLRHIQKLQAAGLISRKSSPDRRVVHLNLTPAGQSEMTIVLSRLMQAS